MRRLLFLGVPANVGPMEETEARRRLGEIVKAERLEQYGDKKSAYNAAKVNPTTWDRIEAGEPVQEASLVKVFKALGWTAAQGWVVLGGGDPPATIFHAGRGSSAAERNPVRDAIAKDPRLDERGRQAVLDTYDRELDAAQRHAG